MTLECFIIKVAERCFHSSQAQAKLVRQEYVDSYETYAPQIAKLCSLANHWHGTGRYRYVRIKDSQDIRDERPTYDVLASIIDSDGLQPYKDLWIESGGNTVSLASVRMHARLFARVHAYEKSSLVYELGSLQFWLRLYASLIFVWCLSDTRSQVTVLRCLFRGRLLRDIQTWESAIRTPDKKRSVQIVWGFRRNVSVSDIAGNYPLLLGIVAKREDLVSTTGITRKVESRSLKAITLAQCTHIEVPLENTAETEEFLRMKGVSIPVIPLEFVDMYLANQTLRTLSYI
jgi:hypothetical protein